MLIVQWNVHQLWQMLMAKPASFLVTLTKWIVNSQKMWQNVPRLFTVNGHCFKCATPHSGLQLASSIFNSMHSRLGLSSLNWMILKFDFLMAPLSHQKADREGHHPWRTMCAGFRSHIQPPWIKTKSANLFWVFLHLSRRGQPCWNLQETGEVWINGDRVCREPLTCDDAKYSSKSTNQHALQSATTGLNNILSGHELDKGESDTRQFLLIPTLVWYTRINRHSHYV